MRLKFSIAFVFLGSLFFVAGYGVSLKENHVRINIDKNSNVYKSVYLEMKKTNPEFFIGKDFDIKMFKIYSQSANCVFAYPSKPIAYSGKDFLYCFDSGWSGPMRRL